MGVAQARVALTRDMLFRVVFFGLLAQDFLVDRPIAGRARIRGWRRELYLRRDYELAVFAIVDRRRRVLAEANERTDNRTDPDPKRRRSVVARTRGGRAEASQHRCECECRCARGELHCFIPPDLRRNPA